MELHILISYDEDYRNSESDQWVFVALSKGKDRSKRREVPQQSIAFQNDFLRIRIYHNLPRCTSSFEFMQNYRGSHRTFAVTDWGHFFRVQWHETRRGMACSDHFKSIIVSLVLTLATYLSWRVSHTNAQMNWYLVDLQWNPLIHTKWVQSILCLNGMNAFYMRKSFAAIRHLNGISFFKKSLARAMPGHSLSSIFATFDYESIGRRNENKQME